MPITRRQVRFLLLLVIAAVLTVSMFAWVRPRAPRPPGPPLTASLVGGLRYDDGNPFCQIQFRALYGWPDKGAFLVLVATERGTLEVSRDLQVHTPGGIALGLSPAVLREGLKLGSVPQAERLAADLDGLIRHIVSHDLTADGSSTGVRRWKDTAAHDPSLWYEDETGLKLYPPGAERPKTLLHPSK
jgi:hypothetical protein